jgi:S-adenosylmethionine:tRNA ribosyltransferase-isomerase
MDASKIIDKYGYRLPPERIAQRPAKPRDAARLLVYDRKTKKIFFDKFFNLDKHLPAKSVLVINDTKVVPARLIAKLGREKVELFYVGRAGRVLRFMADRSLEKGTTVKLGRLRFKILGREERWYRVLPSFPASKIFYVLERRGRTPLPPYLAGSPLSEAERREKYQTIFADQKGSVAAPTASLHFTERLFDKLAKRGVEVVRVTLHVNLGTFAPLAEQNIKSGKLHSEEYAIGAGAAKILNAAKRSGKKIVAVGTTSCRTLESAAVKGKIIKLSGTTDIFIRPPRELKFVDALITNFHVPRSSLLMLVASLVGRKKLLALYALALKKKMKFLSFGDGMLIL